MVYGRILYNNIKEYTPKWYPTIPYSQAVRPTFSNSFLKVKKEHHKSSPPSIPAQPPKPDGDFSPKSSNKTHGCGKSSSSHALLLCIIQSTPHSSPFINLITNIEPTKLPLPKKKLTRKNSENSKKLKEVNDLITNSCNSYLIIFFSSYTFTMIDRFK